MISGSPMSAVIAVTTKYRLKVWERHSYRAACVCQFRFRRFSVLIAHRKWKFLTLVLSGALLLRAI